MKVMVVENNQKYKLKRNTSEKKESNRWIHEKVYIPFPVSFKIAFRSDYIWLLFVKTQFHLKDISLFHNCETIGSKRE